METNYIAEAFKKLNLLENDFNFSVGPEAADDLRSFVADDVDVPTEEPIIDVAAETAEDLQDTYVGKVILECSCCHTRIYKDIADTFIDDETGLANTNEECPVCHTTSGFNVIGKIEEFTEVKEEPVESEEPTEEPIENDDFSEEELHEAFKGLKETYKRRTFKDTDDLTEAIEKVEVKTNEGNAIVSSEDEGKVTVDLRDATNEAVEDNDTSIVPLDTEDIETIETNEAPVEDEEDNSGEEVPLEDTPAEDLVDEPDEEESEDEFEESLNEGRKAFTKADIERGLENLVRKHRKGSPVAEDISSADLKKGMENLVKAHEDDENETEEPEKSLNRSQEPITKDTLEKGLQNTVKKHRKDESILSEDDLRRAAKEADDHITPADRAGLRARQRQDESLNESKADLTSRDLKAIHKIADRHSWDFGDIYGECFEGLDEVTVEAAQEQADTMCKDLIEDLLSIERPDLLKKVEDIPANEMCQVLNLEDVWIIITDDDLEDLMDESLNESISRLVETYLRRVYENVASYKVTDIKSKNGLVIEGLISFESGKEKPTTFIFESKENSKTGIVYRGLNEMFSNSKNAFILRGKKENNKFIPESLTYRYNTNTINESNESIVTKVSGRVLAR